jgi:hypothetical protein
MKKLYSIIFCLLVLLSDCPLSAQSTKPVSLAASYPIEKLEKMISPLQDWHPYPTYSKPEGFEKVPETVKQAYINSAEKFLDKEWPHFPATLFLEFVRNGNRSNYEQMSFNRRKRLATLVLAEIFEHKKRFMDDIVNGIWAICEESFWGIPAHNKGRGLPDIDQPIVDLFAAETGSLMSWIHYLMSPALDRINPLITKRMIAETDRRILTPYLEHTDWGWMGFNWRERSGYMRPVNNWNPWINSNIIACVLLLEKNPQRRLKILHKAMDSIDNFTHPYPPDGGCDEGPSYWGRAAASLYDCLELLYLASNGRINIFDEPLIINMGSFITKAYISQPYFINFADASAKMSINAPIVFRYGKAINNKSMMSFAAFEAQAQDIDRKTLSGSFGVLNRVLPALFTVSELLTTEPSQPFIRDVWLPDIQVMTARSFPNSNESFYLAAKGGHNDESHNHNDVGTFIVYAGGEPVLIDAGAQTYTAKTFSSQRYELWNNQSAYHNLPTINGVMQKEGHLFKAKDVRYTSSDQSAQLSLDISTAYSSDSFVESWQRSIILNRGKNVSIIDNYELSQFIEPLTLNFLTPLETDLSNSGKIILSETSGKKYILIYPYEKFEAFAEIIPIKDSRMHASWGQKLRRIILKGTDQSRKGQIIITIEE